MVSNAGLSCRVLIVEDESLIAEMMADVLRDHGIEAEVAVNVEDALRHLTSGEPCDLLFTDIDLHDRIDGTALSWVARKLRPGLPVIYASGSTRLNQLAAVPGSRFFPKPYDPEAVCSTITRMAAAH